jgi:hypothetical protein
MVFGILNLVFGGISVLGNACCCLGFAGLLMGLQSLQQPNAPPEQRDVAGMFTAFTDNIPGFQSALGGYLAAAVLLSVMQIISGIGLVWIQNWGRWLCVLWAVLRIAMTVAMFGYLVGLVMPGMPKVAQDMEKWLEKMEEKQRQKGMVPPPRQKLDQAGDAGSAANLVLPMASGGFTIIYAFIAFIFMVLPQTGRAIARYHGRDDGLGRPRRDDLYDEDYERQRRPPEPPPPSGF